MAAATEYGLTVGLGQQIYIDLAMPGKAITMKYEESLLAYILQTATK
jgi:hypothetical protein